MTALEICLSTPEEARLAGHAGAQRVELCADLSVGGVTPHLDDVAEVLNDDACPTLQVMIRPRGGTFVLAEGELQTMIGQINEVRRLADQAGEQIGIVLGALTSERRVDVRALRELVQACGTAPVTFHKAVDETPDVLEAAEALMDCGVSRVLTSGGAIDATHGIPGLRRLVEHVGHDLDVIAAGGIRAHNVRRVVDETGVPDVHLRAVDDRPGSKDGTREDVIHDVRRALGRTEDREQRG